MGRSTSDGPTTEIAISPQLLFTCTPSSSHAWSLFLSNVSAGFWTIQTYDNFQYNTFWTSARCIPISHNRPQSYLQMFLASRLHIWHMQRVNCCSTCFQKKKLQQCVCHSWETAEWQQEILHGMHAWLCVCVLHAQASCMHAHLYCTCIHTNDMIVSVAL